MTKEEAIKYIDGLHVVPCEQLKEFCDERNTAIDMAIEALSQPIVAKHFDIQSGYIYCSPQIAENVKVVVRCKDCKWWNGSSETVHNSHLCRNWSKFGSINTSADDFCSWGERREP